MDDSSKGLTPSSEVTPRGRLHNLEFQKVRDRYFEVIQDLWHSMPIESPMGTVMPTRNIVLTDHQETLLERLVSSGRYQNASEVLREGLRLVERQEAEDKARLRALRDAARLGIEDVEAGRVHDLTSSGEVRAHLNSLAQRTVARSRAR